MLDSEIERRPVCAGLAAGDDFLDHGDSLHCPPVSVETEIEEAQIWEPIESPGPPGQRIHALEQCGNAIWAVHRADMLGCPLSAHAYRRDKERTAAAPPDHFHSGSGPRKSCLGDADGRDLACKRLIQMRTQPGNAPAIEPHVPVHDDHRHRGQLSKHRQQTRQFAPKELARLIRMDPHHGNDLFCGKGCVGPVVKGEARRIGSGLAIIDIEAGKHCDALFQAVSSIAAIVEIAFPSSRLLT